MFKKVFLYLLIVTLFCAVDAIAQDVDSVNFVKAAWIKKRLKRNVTLYQYHFNQNLIFGAKQYISFVIVRNRGLFRRKFHLAGDAKELMKTSEMGQKNKALVAINGNFFDIKNGGAVDFIKINGEVINASKSSGKPAFHQKAAIVIKQGKPKIINWDGLVNWEEWIPYKNVMVNGPLLFLNKRDNYLDSSSFNVTRHPRTCVGKMSNGNIVLVVADGRNEVADGLNLFELRQIVRWLGCDAAINFDGGGSSTLWTKKYGVVNHPSDNKVWDNEGERKVANVLLLK